MYRTFSHSDTGNFEWATGRQQERYPSFPGLLRMQLTSRYVLKYALGIIRHPSKYAGELLSEKEWEMGDFAYLYNEPSGDCHRKCSLGRLQLLFCYSLVGLADTSLIGFQS